MSTSRPTRSAKSLQHRLAKLFIIMIAVSGIWLLASADHAATEHAAPFDTNSHDATSIDTPQQRATWEPSQRSCDATPASSPASTAKTIPTMASEPRVDDRAPTYPTRPLYLLACILLN